jgi:hypothetical protein
MSICNLVIGDFEKAGKDIILDVCPCGKAIREHPRVPIGDLNIIYKNII